MDASRYEQTRKVLSGLILGEMLSWTNMYENSQLLPYWTRRKRRELETEHDTNGILEQVVPFSLNVLPAPLYPGPGAKTEWFIFQLRTLAEVAVGSAEHLEAWLKLADSTAGTRLSVSETSTVKNLQTGVRPPRSGQHNPHYFDDGACFRALAISCYVKEEPLETVTKDASISHAEDGVWAACAVAAFAACKGSVATRLKCALEQLPQDSWSARSAEQLLAHVSPSRSPVDLARRLTGELSSYLYSYGNAAPETVPAALAILTFTGGALEASLLCAQSVPRIAGSLVPLVSALCGTLPGAQVHPETLEHPIKGIALPFLAVRTPEDYLNDLRG